MAFLKSGALQGPRAVTTPPAKNEDQAGFVKPSFEEGSLLLKNKDGAFFRLVWQKKESGSPAATVANDQRRALPPGDYTLTGYTIVRRDDQKKEWFLWATGRAIGKLTVRAGKEQQVRVDETIQARFTARSGVDSVLIQVAVSGEHHSGLSIFREGQRIPIHYHIASAQGQELATGTVEYG